MSNTPPNIPQIQQNVKQEIDNLCRELAKAKNDFNQARNKYNDLSRTVRTHPDFDSKKHGVCFNNLTRDGRGMVYAKGAGNVTGNVAKNMAHGAKNIFSSFFNKGNKVAPVPQDQRPQGRGQQGRGPQMTTY
jgi:hypothetical protein